MKIDANAWAALRASVQTMHANSDRAAGEAGARFAFQLVLDEMNTIELQPDEAPELGGYPAPHYDEDDTCQCPDHVAMRAQRRADLDEIDPSLTLLRSYLRAAPSRRDDRDEQIHLLGCGCPSGSCTHV